MAPPAVESAASGNEQPPSKRCRVQCQFHGPHCSACGQLAAGSATAAVAAAQSPAADARLAALLEAMVARAISAREPATAAASVAPPRARAPSASEANPTAPGKGSSSQRCAALVAAKAAGAPLPVHDIFIADYGTQTKSAVTVSAAVLALVGVLPVPRFFSSPDPEPSTSCREAL